MKIDGTSLSAIRSILAATKVSPANHNSLNTEQDKIDVSGNAQVFQNLVQKAKELPDIRADKVQEVVDRIESGKFSLDVGSIAAGMLSVIRREEDV